MSEKNNIIKKLSLVLPILIVVFVSGCIGGGDTAELGKGIVIQGWQPDFPSLSSGDAIKFQLKAQNLGEKDATTVNVQVMGIDLKDWGQTSEQAISWTLIQAPDLVSETPGETKTAQIAGLIAPTLPEGTSFTYEPIVRVSYNYLTSATKPITIVDYEELRRLIQDGETLEGKPTLFTAGPLSIEITTGKYLKTQTEKDPPLPLNIKISNTGGGHVIRKDNLDGSAFLGQNLGSMDSPVKVIVKLPTTTSTAPGGMAFQATDNECDSSGKWTDLWQGKTTEITCNLKVTEAAAGTRIEKMITVELEYRYAVDSTTSVTVIGKKTSTG